MVFRSSHILLLIQLKMENLETKKHLANLVPQ